MQTVRRIVVWLAQILIEALLLSALFGALVAGELGFLDGLMAGLLVVPVVLFLSGYYVTRGLAAALKRIRPRQYPLVAAILFVLHMIFVFISFRPTRGYAPLGQAIQLPFLVGGGCIVFGSAFAGNWILRKWNQTSSNGSTAQQLSSGARL